MYGAPGEVTQQVLVVSDNTAIAVPGSTMETLALTPGKLGIFSVKTGLAIDGSVLSDAREFFLAVAGPGTPNFFMKSAADSIQLNGIDGYNLRCFTPERPQVVAVQFCDIECDTDYVLKFGMTNPKEFQNYGWNPVAKRFAVRSACCVGCDCPQGNCADVTIKVLNAINSDPDGLFTADLILNDAEVTPAPIDIADCEAVLAAVALDQTEIDALTIDDGCPIIRITMVPQAIAAWCGIPRDSYYPKTPTIDVAFVGTNCCVPAISTCQYPVMANVLGVDLMSEEYFDGGYEGNPGAMRLSSFGLTVADPLYFAVPTMGYHVLTIRYTNDTIGAGVIPFKNAHTTQLVFPFANSVALLSAVAALDSIVAHQNFEPLTADATACPVDGTTVVSIGAIDNPDLDGLGMPRRSSSAPTKKALQLKASQKKAAQKKAAAAKATQLKADQKKAADLKAKQQKADQLKADQIKASQQKDDRYTG